MNKLLVLAKTHRREIGYILLGGFAGYAFYYFIGCPLGGCVLLGNPVIPPLVGMLIGYSLASDARKR